MSDVIRSSLLYVNPNGGNVFEHRLIATSSQITTQQLQSRPNPVLYKGKAVPLQAWTGPESSRKLRFPDFVTTAQDCGKVVNLTHRPPLPPGNTPGTHSL